MPWDCFCPKCSEACLGSMTDDYEKIVEEQKKFEHKIIKCFSCQTYFEFDSGEIREVIEE